MNLVYAQASGFSTARVDANSEDEYWDTTGSLVLVGLVAAVYILTR